MSISHIVPKIKSFWSSPAGSNFYIFFIVILTAFGSFGLGRLSRINENKEPVKISMNGSDITASVANSAPKTTKTPEILSSRFVASKRGKKYYSEDCPSAKNIKEENKIYFDSQSEAESGGYTASSSC